MATTSNPPADLGRTRQSARFRLKASDFPRLSVLLNPALLVFSLCFFALHFVHLSADFPNFSRWMDWSKYTDEGWYGDAAIRHFLLGHWYVAGDFNPAVALPVWPAIEGILFSFTGVSLVAARALTVFVFGGILLASWHLLNGRLTAHPSASPLIAPSPWQSLAPSVAVLLLVTNPFCFVFTRLAILEPLLVLITLVALLAARRARPPHPGSSASRQGIFKLNRGVILSLGLLLPLLILTKTTGLFLVPSIAWILFASLGRRIRPFLQVGGAAAAIAFALWLAYFFLCVRPHYLVDYQYLFSANSYTRITCANFFSVISSTFQDGKWFGVPLFTCALASTLVVVLSWKRLRETPLVPSLLLWALGYTAFLAYHDNLQPRYYLVVAVPLILLIPVVFSDLLLPRLGGLSSRRTALALGSAGLAFIAIPDAFRCLSILRHPQYTLLSAARQVHDFIARDSRQHPAHNQLLLSISGSDISLMTGLHSICDDFGTSDLADRVKQYNPGWYAAWNLIEDDKMDALSSQFQVTRVASFPAMDDSDRNILVLYRLEPAGEEQEQPRRRRGRISRNRVGQQPSSSQLKH